MAAPAHIARENGKKGGRPKGAVSAATKEKLTAQETFRKMVEAEIMPIARALIEKAYDGDVPAIRELLDRAWGRASQSVELTGKNGVELFKPDAKTTIIVNDFEKKLKDSL